MPEDTTPDTDAPQEQPDRPEPPHLAPGQLMLQVSPNGLIVMSVAIAQIRPEDFSAACKDWILNHNPGMVKELVEEQVQRMQAERNRLQLVTDPGTIRDIRKGRLKKGLQA
jgi:hypothetical protein